MPRISLSLILFSSAIFAMITFFQLKLEFISAETVEVCLYAPVSLYAMTYGINCLPGKLISDHKNYCRDYLGLTTYPAPIQHVASIKPIFHFAPLIVSLFLIYCLTIEMPSFSLHQIISRLFLFQTLFVLALIDYKHFMLPEEITLPLIVLGLAFAVLGSSDVSLEDAVIGAIFPTSALATAFILIKLVTRKELMGIGDYYIISVLGAWFGMSKLPCIFSMATIVSIAYALLFKTRKIPLGLPLMISAYTVTFVPAITI